MEALTFIVFGAFLALFVVLLKALIDKTNAYLRRNETAEQRGAREKASAFKARQNNLTAIQMLFGVGVVAAFAWWNWNSRLTTETESTYNEQVWIAEMQLRVKATLKDPASAQFGRAWVVNVKGAPMVCGTVNAKNSFGGYSGAQGFFAGGELILMADTMKPGEWARLCEGAGG